MTATFFFEPHPSDDSYRRIAAISPANPFQTKSYAAAQRSLGCDPVILGVRSGEEWNVACSGFFRKGRLRRSLIIPSVPSCAGDSVFWEGLLGLCRRQRVSLLELETFACFSADIPHFPGETNRRTRAEFFLDLQGTDLPALLSKNHRHSIKRARAAELTIRRSISDDAIDAHARLVSFAHDRHRNKGEDVHGGSGLSHRALLDSGSGELFQALKGDAVLSSALVLFSNRGAYYQSAGTDPDGLTCGASQFLVHNISMTLQQEGCRFFFLGGTDQLTGDVATFKACFGASRVDLESASVYLGSKILKKLSTFVSASLQGRAWLRVDHLHVFSIDPCLVTPVGARRLRMEKLSDDAVKKLPQDFAQNVERIARYGFNDAYAFFRDDRVVHVMWLIPAEHERLRQGSILQLRPGEAEIAHALTIDGYRGQGVFPEVIGRLAQVACGTGITRIYAVVAPHNTNSARGLLKTGKWRRRHLVRVFRLFGRGGQFVLYRGHRWG